MLSPNLMDTLPSIVATPLFFFAPILFVGVFALLLIPSLLVTGAKPEAAVKAIGCTIVKAIGLFMLAASAVVLLQGFMSMDFPDSQVLSSLLLLFVIGVGLMIYESTVLETIDEASSSVATSVFNHTCILVGQLVCILSVLSFAFSFLFTQSFVGWDLLATLFLLGLLLMLMFSVHVNEKARKTTKKKK